MKSNTFGSKVKALRVKNGYTQKAVANKLGVDSSYISQIENDKFVPRRRASEIMNAVSVAATGNHRRKIALPKGKDTDLGKTKNYVVNTGSTSVELHLPNNQKVVISFM